MRETGQEGFQFQKTPQGAVLTDCYNPDGMTEIVVPTEADRLPVCGIAEHAFYHAGSKIRRITVPGTVKRIAPRAMELVFSLEELVLEEGVEELGEDFLSVTSVKELQIPASVRLIENPALLECRLLVSPENPVYLSDDHGLYQKKNSALMLLRAYMREGDISYRVGGQVTGIAETAFTGCEDLRTVYIPAGVQRIAEGAFSNARDAYGQKQGITDIVTEAGLADVNGNTETAGDREAVGSRKTAEETATPSAENAAGLFFRDGLGFYEKLPSGNTRLLRYLEPSDAALHPTGEIPKTEAVLREDVAVIAREAFLGCNLKKVVFPAAVREIHGDIFLNCPLEEAEINGETVLFPWENTFQCRQLLASFGKNGKLYDFMDYDELLAESSLNKKRLEMMCMRLRFPTDLSAEHRKLFTEKIREGMKEVIPAIAAADSMETLTLLAEEGFFTEENMEELIEAAAACENKDAMVYLMHYRQEHFTVQEFDFSL